MIRYDKICVNYRLYLHVFTIYRLMWTGSQWRDHEAKTCCSKHALPFHLPAFTASSAPFAETSTSTQPAKWKDDASESHIIIFLPYSTIFYPLSDIFWWLFLRGVFCCQASPNGKFRTCKSIFKVPLWPWLSEPDPNHIRTKWLEDLELGRPDATPSPRLQDYKIPVYFG